MPRHPTVQVPNIGPMDHAWDLLGEWQAEFELPETESPVHGKVTFRSWTDAELMLDPIEAAIAGIPSTVPLEDVTVGCGLRLDASASAASVMVVYGERICEYGSVAHSAPLRAQFSTVTESGVQVSG